MNYRQLKALAKCCDKKQEVGHGMHAPVFYRNMVYATNGYAIVKVTGIDIDSLCESMPDEPRSVPDVLIDGFAAVQEVKPDDVSIEVTSPIKPETVDKHTSMEGDEKTVIINTKFLKLLIAVFDSFNIDPVVTCMQNPDDHRYMLLNGHDSSNEIRAALIGKRERK